MAKYEEISDEELVRRGEEWCKKHRNASGMLEFEDFNGFEHFIKGLFEVSGEHVHTIHKDEEHGLLGMIVTEEEVEE